MSWMRNRFVILILAFFSIASGFAQSKLVKTYIEENPEGTSFYFYQSVLRVLHSEGKDGDSDYNKFIKNLDCVRFFYLSDSISKKNFSKDFISKIREEGFEDLMAFRESGFNIQLFMKGDGEDAEFLGVVAESTFKLIFEMEGSPNLKYINTLSDLNLKKIKNVIPANLEFQME